MSKRQKIDFQFTGWGEFLGRCAGPSDISESCRSSRNHCKDFTWVDFYADAEKLSRFGWPEGRVKIGKISTNITRQIVREVPEQGIQFAPAGFAPIVARYAQGRPDSMLLWQDTPEPKRIIRVGFDMGVSCRIGADVLHTRGAAVYALISSLEKMRFDVSLDLIMTCRQYTTRIPVKRSTEYLEPDRLAFILSHPAVLRCLWFSFLETTDTKTRRACDVDFSYGSPEDTPKAGYDIVIGSAKSGAPEWESPESAGDWAREQLKIQGVYLD